MTAPLANLASSTRALERGNWPGLLAAAASRHVAERTDDAARLTFIHSTVATSMRCQALGSAVRADEHLDTAARALPPAYRRSVHGRCFAVLPAQPRDELVVSLLVWRTARVVFREQRGLDEHRERLRPGRLTTLEILVVAYGEYLRWVECDYFLTAPEADVRDVPFEAQSGPLRDRATDLCRLAEPAAPQVGEPAWRRSGGKARLCAEALELLAAAGLVPEAGPGALPADVPVRRGRAEAYRRACQRRDDLD